MSKFIKILFLFLLILLGLAYGCDFVISKGLRKSDLRCFQVWNDIYASNIKGEALIIGSSRAWSQYDPQILDSIVGLDFYNLGIDGHKLDYQLIRYNTYRRFCPKPKYIIHNVDFATLGLSSTGYDREQFFPYVFDDSLLHVVCKMKDISILERKIPLIRYFGYREVFEDGVKSFFGEKKLIDGGLVKGYRGETHLWDGTKLDQIEKIDYDKNPVAIKLFDDYLNLSKIEGIEVILVFAPLYIEASNKIVNPTEMYSMYKELADKYNFMLLDFTNDSISYDKENFYNAMHLNKRGAEKFSVKLAHQLDSLINKNDLKKN